MATSYQRRKRRRNGMANFKIVRYADDFVIMVSGDRHHAEELREKVAAVLEPLGCGCRRRRPPWCISTRGSTSVSTSAASGNAGLRSGTSTPSRAVAGTAWAAVPAVTGVWRISLRRRASR